MAMSAHDRFRTTLAALGFALAMLILGLLNPNAVPGRTGCGLVCDAHVAAPLAGLAPAPQ
jgi:hypothetical protein